MNEVSFGWEFSVKIGSRSYGYRIDKYLADLAVAKMSSGSRDLTTSYESLPGGEIADVRLGIFWNFSTTDEIEICGAGGVVLTTVWPGGENPGKPVVVPLKVAAGNLQARVVANTAKLEFALFGSSTS